MQNDLPDKLISCQPYMKHAKLNPKYRLDTAISVGHEVLSQPIDQGG